ncbi:glycosyltransferase family 2 protein [Tropicibacter oceani]|uniref:Glycosyltransferase family 2 protein n=1 Tax=Tropicibacter oceani TaxID=3058420 RepID=A0ABY8QH85_9RHOB|nr:glycosyltransferase family 2 protein [Tropicibacter oceani]WGW03338.1 glycosyltransferase family 2 protein [Tropicibacter oceani]
MSTQSRQLVIGHLSQAQARRGQPISRILMDDGQVAPRSMVGALAEASRTGQTISRVLEAESLASRQDILAAQAQHYGAMVLRRDDTPPDPDLARLLPAEFCLMHGVLPWMRLGDTLLLATARPEDYETLLGILPGGLGPVMMALTLEADVHDEIAARHGDALANRAETWRAPEDSCRDINSAGRGAIVVAALAAGLCLLLLAFAPAVFFGGALLMALGSLVASQGMKLAALLALPRRQAPAGAATLPKNPPTMSILVPLFKEEEIAETLIARLTRLTYPKALLDVVLILEAGDDCTHRALARTRLPPWCRVIEVPPGAVTTKPRAMNYAFRFTRGQIIGVYDAEDAPAPDQLTRVAEHFSRAPPNVACLQGILDFYNPRANWLSRCFAVEYASWFRVLLPGLARLGLAVPLGGTTIFFRRAALEAVQGWDAHNVTEDADLGFRLARQGYVTELIPTATREEANNRFWPWIKQRSRWLKGYGITWWVHSRRPRQLWRELGPKRFAGMQILLMGTLLQFALAPVLWSFWLVLFGLPHPLDPHLTRPVILTLTALFLSAEAISIVIGLAAVARSPHRGLTPWVPTLFAYFPLGTLAIYKALYETLFKPFYWDKTQHGHSAPDSPAADIPGDT